MVTVDIRVVSACVRLLLLREAKARELNKGLVDEHSLGKTKCMHTMVCERKSCIEKSAVQR